MSGDSDRTSWERVSAELRACREAQQRAYGDIDNTTLGRYLAGELSAEERHQVEAAMDQLPELRKLTDLVRDVLADFEPVEATPPVLPEPVPVVLPFKARPARRPTWTRTRGRAVLVAAACLLLGLGLWLQWIESPKNAGLWNDRRDVAALSPGRRDEPPPGPLSGAPGLGEHPSLFATRNLSDREAALFLARTEATAENLEKAGQAKEARELTSTVVAKVTDVAEQLQQKGELDRAAPLLERTHDLCKRALGPEHPETRRSLNSLANVYQVAVNSTPADAIPVGTYAKHLPTAVPGPSYHNPLPAGPGSTPGAVADLGPNRTGRPLLGSKLSHQGPNDMRANVVPVLTEALKQAPTPKERQALARALARLGPVARDATPVLQNCLENSTSVEEKQVLLDAVAEVAAPEQAAPTLVANLRSEAPQVRRTAAECLVRLGPAAQGVLPELARRAEGKDTDARDVYQRLRGREGHIGAHDPAGCFNPVVVRQASRACRDVSRMADVQVLVETAARWQPEGVRMSAARTPQLGPRSVYVLFCKEGPRVWAAAGPELEKTGLTAKRLRTLVEETLPKGLDEALAKVPQAVQAWWAQKQAAPAGTPDK